MVWHLFYVTEREFPFSLFCPIQCVFTPSETKNKKIKNKINFKKQHEDQPVLGSWTKCGKKMCSGEM